MRSIVSNTRKRASHLCRVTKRSAGESQQAFSFLGIAGAAWFISRARRARTIKWCSSAARRWRRIQATWVEFRGTLQSCCRRSARTRKMRRGWRDLLVLFEWNLDADRAAELAFFAAFS